jgi:death on curing protein
MTGKDWHWISKLLAITIHDRQLAEHGGLSGIRDSNMLESALARPQNLSVYGTPDAAELAASYGYGIAKNHPFVDGNKRTAFVACELFLDLNGWELTASDVNCVLIMLDVAAGEASEVEFADWIRRNSVGV